MNNEDITPIIFILKVFQLIVDKSIVKLINKTNWLIVTMPRKVNWLKNPTIDINTKTIEM
ncbi:hypothetical protein NCCP2331_08250 [Sporosarcina sp. NCCP-2331]|nr:hypothetical protein NCCP2331_08250 [Sporosarcina sp. NCCP-2331]GLB54455.1 hypothetical protein NCCP2378_02400 [Sporosarcina sp. NCCP-2378]